MDGAQLENDLLTAEKKSDKPYEDDIEEYSYHDEVSASNEYSQPTKPVKAVTQESSV